MNPVHKGMCVCERESKSERERCKFDIIIIRMVEESLLSAILAEPVSVLSLSFGYVCTIKPPANSIHIIRSRTNSVDHY